MIDDLDELISTYGYPSEEIWKSQEKMKYDRYIEAQVWDDAIIKAYKV